MNPDTGTVPEYHELIKYSDGDNTEEIGRMFQGLGPNSSMPHGTDMLFCIHRAQMPNHKRATSIGVLRADQPEKSNPTRWTAGDDTIVYNGSSITKTAGVTTTKLLFNSVISRPNARFMGINLKVFHLCSESP
jgi:hypothetical protein